ncbi:MAG: hypothetical protein NC079_05505 [Clostridium sp.]|nr:hypothetical protein [Acetatifactor muris]MCM1527256.1 hypothetical protein [Bacteroides sp.]MCM1563049.1 hypothetical protein [Clostridium sp.]
MNVVKKIQKCMSRLSNPAEWAVLAISGLMIAFVAVNVFLFRIDGYTSDVERDRVILGVVSALLPLGGGMGPDAAAQLALW